MEEINFWKSIWSLQVPPKIQFFLWRLVSNACPTNEQLFKRGGITTPMCRRCNIHQESVSHLFLQCEHSKRVWSVLSLGFGFDAGNPIPFKMLMKSWFERAPDSSCINLSVYILWQIWLAEQISMGREMG